MNRSGKKIEKYGISFDSLLELDIFEEFRSRGIELLRGNPITVFDGFNTKTRCYSNDNRLYEIKPVSPKVQNIEYTPDFILQVNKSNVYIELKGFANETFRYRWKLFKKWIETNEPNAKIFLIKRRHNGRVKPNDNAKRIEETKNIVDNILKIIENNEI